jgi:hypothetical protein
LGLKEWIDFIEVKYCYKIQFAPNSTTRMAIVDYITKHTIRQDLALPFFWLMVLFGKLLIRA